MTPRYREVLCLAASMVGIIFVLGFVTKPTDLRFLGALISIVVAIAALPMKRY